MKFTKENKRGRIKHRIRAKVKGTATRPRLCVYRSNKAIYCQIINDLDGVTLVSADSSGVAKDQPKVDQAKVVGKLIAEKASSENITSVVFDRGGYLYHGRVKALADGAREGGLQF